MIKEPTIPSIEGGHQKYYVKAEFILLIFIILFGIIGLSLCFGMLDDNAHEIGLIIFQTDLKESIS